MSAALAQGIQRSQAEEALKRSERARDTAQRIARVGNWEYVTGRDGARWSDEMYRIFDFAPRAFTPTYKTFLRSVHPDDRGLLWEAIRGALRDGRQDNLEYRIVRPNGEVRAVQTRYEVGPHQGIASVRLTGTVQDITERKEMEEALWESEERHRQQAQELDLLHEVRTALSQELDDLPSLFREVVEAIARTYGYTLVSAYLLRGGELVLQHQVGYGHVIERIQVTEGVSGEVVRTGRAALLTDARADPTFLGAIEGIVSEVCVPLFDGGRPVGILNIESTNGVELTDGD